MSMMSVLPSLLTASKAPAALMLPAYPLRLPNTALMTPGPCRKAKTVKRRQNSSQP